MYFFDLYHSQQHDIALDVGPASSSFFYVYSQIICYVLQVELAT